MEKPPLGLMPREIWRELVIDERVKELLAAVYRYREAKKEIPSEWREEYRDLMRVREVIEILPA